MSGHGKLQHISTEGLTAYQVALLELEGLLSGERDYISNTANISSLVYHEINKVKNNAVNWVGFYFVKKNNKGEDELVWAHLMEKLLVLELLMVEVFVVPHGKSEQL